MSSRYLNCFGSVNRPASYAGAMEEQRAWFGRRVVAFLIDWFASVLVALLAFPQFPYGSNGSMLATLAVFVVEITVLTWLTGASFGQRLVRLRVVSIDSGQVPLWRVLVRTLSICLVIGRGLRRRWTRVRPTRAHPGRSGGAS